MGVLRTLFLDFEHDDWEHELAAFKSTDVEVPATLTVDGRTYPGVGVSFRGASSYFMVGEGSKRSLDPSLDFTEEDQRLDGQRTLNLLNGNGDPSFLRSALYAHIAEAHLPAPHANLVRVVINGESWGLYTNAQQFNRDFLNEHLGSGKGARWKVPGSPRGDGGLRHLGEDLEPYRERFEIKSKDDPEDWAALVRLCRTLSETPIDELEAALAPMLDRESTIGFRALDCALVNEDGYWIRASDDNLHRDDEGVFHLVPHDMNESFHENQGVGPGGGSGRAGFGPPPRDAAEDDAPERAADAPPSDPDEPRRRGLRAGPDGPGAPGGPGGPGRPRIGADLDPFVGMDDDARPLRSRLLQVPSIRARYAAALWQIAAVDLDWSRLGPFVVDLRDLIDAEVAADTKKLATDEAFRRETDDAVDADGKPSEGSLRAFTEKRRAFLLSHPEIAAAAPARAP